MAVKNYTRLFTPGPLSTSAKVRASMNVDIGTRTQAIVDLTKIIRVGLEEIAGCGSKYTSILLQGSGTFAVEAMITSLIHPEDLVLIITNGIYGDRITEICNIHAIKYLVLKSSNTAPINIEEVKKFLQKEKRITHIIAVQFETGVGILNDINALTTLASQYNCEVLVDAMSAFGALPLHYVPSLLAIASSANKCLHGVPGISFVIVRVDKLLKIDIPNSRTLCLDLKKQWQEFEHSGQWRFTPPTHVLHALREAMDELQNLGGVQARLEKYNFLTNRLISALAAIDIYPVVQRDYRASIATTFVLGNSHSIDANYLYEELFTQGFVIYPSNLIQKKSFRICCMGDLDTDDIDELIVCIKSIVRKNS